VGSDWVVDDLSASGDVMREHFGNGVVGSYERDIQQLPTRIKVARASQSLYDVALGHGAFGAITSVTDGDGAGLDHTASFGYDGGGRLTAASIGAAGPAQYQFSFSYDGLQNMIGRTVSGPTQLGVLAGRYDYTGAGPRQLARVARASDGATLASFAYDAAGRQTQHAGKTLRYNALSQLIRVDGLAGGGSVEHRYGYDGERVVTRDALGAASYWLTPDVIESGGVRDHYVRVNGRAVVRITLGAASSASATGVTRAVTGLLRGTAAALVAALLLSLAATTVRRRGRRPLWVVRAGHLALGALLLPGCTAGGLGQTASAVTWQTNRKLYFHQGVGAGPALVTDAAGMVFEERRYEPFGEAIDAYREGSGVTAVDYRREAMNGLNKPSDPDTDMSYHGARWLPTDTAQWLTPDPPVKAPGAKFLLSPWSLHPYQYVEQNPIVFWDPDGRQPDVIDTTIPDTPIANKTFSTADVSRLRDFFVANAANPVPAGGTSGNTDPSKRYSCIGTMNHGIEKLFNKDLWKGNGKSEVDKTQDHMVSKGKTLGEAKVKYTWDNVNKQAKAKGSDWDTVITLADGDQGWSVYLVSVGGGYHSVTVTLDNRDTAHPQIIFSDQNGGSQGWRAFSSKSDFDDFMKSWQDAAGSHYSDPDRKPKPLKHPPVGARYVRLRPDD
jgi:RHS repeat-associated protein